MSKLGFVGIFVVSMGLAGCGSSGPSAEAFDASALKVGESYTISLSFWMQNTGSTGSGIRKNIHFDDVQNNRVVFFFDEALGEKVETLEKGKVYTVTYTYENANTMNMGVATDIK